MASPSPLFCDVAVIGAGGAGMRAALAAAEGGLSVLCLTKVPPTRSHTIAAQGGINAALGNRLPDDWRWHAYDTIRGGDWLTDQDAVSFMCERAGDAIVELEHLGMAFTRAEDGHIYQRAYGGQTSDFGKGGPAYRACASADRTGHALLHTLYAHAVRRGVNFAQEWMALDLIFDAEGACRGVLAWELETGTLHLVRAHAVILATGGYGQAWAATTASSICTGDGGGMIARAGLPLQDMEFVQFHPTSLYGSGILITEGARGEGASLLNAAGERFMQHYAPKSMELASRDVVARAMAVEIMQGRGCGPKADHLHLDLTKLGEEMLRSKLPSVLEIARNFARIDPLRQPVPVLPAVHYTMGGIASNAASEVISLDASGAEFAVPGLLAVGEAACNSVHGANRLGCNSLLDLVVFGKAAGESCARNIRPHAPHAPITGDSLARSLAHLERYRNARGGAPPSRIRREMQQAMQRHAGIFRTHALLEEGVSTLLNLKEMLRHDARITTPGLIWNNDLLDAYETENLLLQALATMQSALLRTESRGAHWRDDHPARDDERWLAHTLVWTEESATVGSPSPRTARRAVRMHAAGAQTFAPEARNY